MGELPTLVSDLALILVLAGVVTLLFKRLHQPLVLGYIVAGFLCSTHFSFTPSVSDTASVQTWADIGVVFLMFTLGLEFSFKKILQMGSSPFIAASTIIFCMIGLGSLAGHFFGWSRMNSLFLGGMLAMSSTTIIFKALDDMGLRQQRFAAPVLSVLVVEDILGIVLMVILSTLAVSNTLEGSALLGSLLQLVLVLVVWFLVGVFVIPTFLRRNRRWMSRETLLIVSLGLCFAMVVLAAKMHYSAAFGAFMMGSILAETIEAEQINDVVGPVKDLFGAIFFVSVGMLVDPAILVEYWMPILVLTLTILAGQALFGTAGFLLSGQPLPVALQCGFSMAQIGEFAFIIASMGVSLHVTAHFLYPIVVAVSVVTTFLTPYMIRLSGPAYHYLERRLPTRYTRALDASDGISSVNNSTAWHRLLKALMRQIIIYAILSVAIIAISFTSLLPLLRHALTHWGGNALCGLITLGCISPFLRAIVMRKNHSDDFRTLWTENRANRFPLVFTVIVRYVLAAAFVFYILQFLSPLSSILHALVSLLLVLLMMASRRLKTGSISLEHLFLRNLRSREVMAERTGKAKPQYARRLLERDLHLSIIDIPMNTQFAGLTLRQLNLARRFGVMLASIQRAGHRINIPGPDTPLFPGDRLQLIGTDQQLTAFAQILSTHIITDPPEERHDMFLRSLTITDESPLCHQSVRESGLRERYHCMLVGFDDGSERLDMPDASRVFEPGDIVWIVGEQENLKQLTVDN